MGYDFTILKSRHNIKITDIYKASKLFKKAINNVGYFYIYENYITLDYTDTKKIRKYYIYISENLKFNPNGRCFIIKFTTENYAVKDSICKDEKLIYLGCTEATRNCEDMVLKVMYEYLKLCPDEFIETDYGYLYTKDELEKIINLSYYDENWCYKNWKNN